MSSTIATIFDIFSNAYDVVFPAFAPLVSIAEGASKLIGMFV